MVTFNDWCKEVYCIGAVEYFDRHIGVVTFDNLKTLEQDIFAPNGMKGFMGNFLRACREHLVDDIFVRREGFSSLRLLGKARDCKIDGVTVAEYRERRKKIIAVVRSYSVERLMAEISGKEWYSNIVRLYRLKVQFYASGSCRVEVVTSIFKGEKYCILHKREDLLEDFRTMYRGYTDTNWRERQRRVQEWLSKSIGG